MTVHEETWAGRAVEWVVYDWWRHSKIRDAMWWVRHRIDPRHRYHVVRTGLEPGYYDQDTLILEVCMALLGSYIEEHGGEKVLREFSTELRERPDKNAPEEWSSGQADYQDEACDIWCWWTQERPAAHADYEKALAAWADQDLAGRCRDRATLRLLTDRENALHDKDQEMLRRLIDIRRSLWV